MAVPVRLPGESEWTETRMRQLQAIKDIAYKIIDFIAQFEDELVRVWNKPKFVLNTHYVITLDRIAEKQGGMVVVERSCPRGLPAQVEEWRELGMVDDVIRSRPTCWQKTLIGSALQPRYAHLPLDTRHFPDLELDILACSMISTQRWTAGWCRARTTRRSIRSCRSFGRRVKTYLH